MSVVLLSLQAVIFAYSAIELVGIAAGETKDPQQGHAARRSTASIWRIAIFYVGSIDCCWSCVLPWTVYKSRAEPVRHGVRARSACRGVGSMMNAVVLTAALSSTNSGLYSTGRILRALAERKEAPRLRRPHEQPRRPVRRHPVHLGRLCRRRRAQPVQVPTEAFDIATAIASLGVVTTWATLVVCQMRLRQRALRGELERPAYRMPGAPWTGWLTLAFLALIVVMMGFAGGAEQVAFFSIPAIAVVLAVGWWLVRRRQSAPESDPTSAVPVVSQ